MTIYNSVLPSATQPTIDSVQIASTVDVDLSNIFKISVDDSKNYTSFLPKVGDLRIQDPDDADDSDYIQFTVDDGLGEVRISSPNPFKFLNDIEILPSGAGSKAINIRDAGDTQDNIILSEDGGIGVRIGVFPMVSHTGNLGSPSFIFSEGHVDKLLAGAGSATAPSYSFEGDPNTGMYNSSPDVIAFSTGGSANTTISSTGISTPSVSTTGAISCDSLEVGGGYGSSGVTIDSSGNVKLNGKLTVDGAIDPTELDMPDDAPIYLDTSKSVSLKWDTSISKIRVNQRTQFDNSVDVIGTLDASTNPMKPKLYSQASEPDIPAGTMAFWWDTNLSQMWLIIDSGGTQYKVQLS